MVQIVLLSSSKLRKREAFRSLLKSLANER